jgi:hypothetical protein
VSRSYTILPLTSTKERVCLKELTRKLLSTRAKKEKDAQNAGASFLKMDEPAKGARGEKKENRILNTRIMKLVLYATD